MVPTAGRAPRQAVAALQRAPGVAWAGLNYLYEAFAIRYRRPGTLPVYPNDPLFPEQVLDQLGFPYAWSITKGSSKDAIAVVDTGVQANHPDLAGQVSAGYNCLSPTALPADDNGHGTMVAGAAAADTNNGLDISGAAWESGVLPVKVLDSQGIGTAAQVACGITWAASHGASVINLSLGGPVSSPVLHAAVRYALSKSVVVVAASGNGASEAPMFPAAYPGVLAVTAEGGTDWPTGFDWFSSYGWWVKLAAPGIDIQGTQLGGGVALGTGTSMAAPFVSAVALLVRAEHPGWTAGQVAADLERTARDAGPPGIDPYYGYGIVQPYAALGGPKLYPVPYQADAYEPNDVLAQAKPIGSTVTPTISPEGDVDWFYKNVTAPGSVTFTVTPVPYDFPGRIRSAEMRPLVQVYGPRLNLLADQLAGLGSNQVTVEVPGAAPGRYYISIANAFGSASWQSYTVTVGVSGVTVPPAFDTPTLLYPAQENQPYYPRVAVADVTGDGRPDVITVRKNAQGTFDLDVYPQAPSGKLGPAIATPLAFDGHSSLDFAVGDLTGDGRPDVAVATVNGVAIFYPSKSGAFTQGAFVPVPTSDVWGAQRLTIADLNGDGRPDVVVHENDGDVYVLWNQASGFHPVKIGSVRAGGAPAVGDVNGDGLRDIGFYYCRWIYLFLQQPGGSFVLEKVTVSSDPSVLISGLAIGDVTGDGRDDVVVAVPGDPGGQLIVYPQTATGKLGPPVSYPANRFIYGVGVADVNGNGRNDVLALGEADSGSGVISMYMQQPDGSLHPGLDLLFPDYLGLLPSLPVGLPALGDVTGDGLPDLVTLFTTDYITGIAVAAQPSGLAWVTNTTPSNLSTGVSPGAPLSASFGRPLDPLSVNTSTVRVMNARTGTFVTAAVSYASAAHTITVRPAATLNPQTPYVVFLSGVADTHGARMPAAFTYRFTTGRFP